MNHQKLTNTEKEFLILLNTYQVEYLVIGGHAVVYHGYQRMIGDLDVWISTEKLNAQRIVTVLHHLGNGLAAEAQSFFALPERVIRIGTPPFQVEHYQLEDRFIHIGNQPPQFEIMTSISGVDFASCYEKRLHVQLNEVPVSMIGLACLKANKKASIRQKDADDYAHLPDV
jgi:hypothetical protein